MHTAQARANAVFFFGLMTLGVVLLCNIATSYWFKRNANPQVDVKVNQLVKFNKAMISGSPADYATLTFDIFADLQSLWNWNTKQLFVFVTLSYENALHEKNQVVVWDRILRTKEESLFELKKVSPEYVFADKGVDLRNTTLTVTLSWDLTPISGLLQLDTRGSYTYTLPSEYVA